MRVQRQILGRAPGAPIRATFNLLLKRTMFFLQCRSIKVGVGRVTQTCQSQQEWLNGPSLQQGWGYCVWMFYTLSQLRIATTARQEASHLQGVL